MFGGWWRRSGPFLLTTCAAGGLPEPAGLEAVSAIDEVPPSHYWLHRPLA